MGPGEGRPIETGLRRLRHLPVLTARALWNGWGTSAVIALVAASSVVALLGPAYVDLPRIGAGGQVTSPLTSFCAWAVALAALRSAVEPSTTLFATAPRVAVHVNVCRVALVAVAGVALLVTLTEASAASVWSPTAALVGEGLLYASVLGPSFCWLLPTTHLMVSSVMGAANRLDLAPWAWILEPTPDLRQIGISSSLLALGLVSWALRAQAVARDAAASDLDS